MSGVWDTNAEEGDVILTYILVRSWQNYFLDELDQIFKICVILSIITGYTIYEQYGPCCNDTMKVQKKIPCDPDSTIRYLFHGKNKRLSIDLRFAWDGIGVCFPFLL